MSDGTVIIDTSLDNRGIESGLGKLQSAVGAGAKAASVAIGAISAALVAAGTASVATGAEFEDSMAKASTLFGDTKVETENLDKSVLKLSNSTGLAASSIGESLYSALSAGLPVTEDMGDTMGFMTKNAKLAAAGFTDVETTVGATAKILNAYKMDVSNTDKVHKILMQTQNKGITTVGELGATLAQVTPTAAAMNVGFEQVGASLATMTAQGTPTAQATTQLNSLFAELGKSGTQANIALEKATQGTEYAGKGFQELMKEGVPLNTILNLMDTYAQNNNLSLLDMFSSIEAGKAGLAMSGKNAEQYTTNLEAMGTQADVVGDAYTKMSDTLKFKSSQMTEGVKNLGIEIYKGMEKPLKKATDTGIKYISKLSKAFEKGGLDGLVKQAGDIFSKIVTNAAKQAPKIIDAASDLILSFVDGIIKNKDKLSTAALEIAKALADGLIMFLPSNLQEPVQAAVDSLTTSFQSGGLKTAIETACTFFENFIEVVGKVASIVLPPMSQALDFLAENLEVIGPSILAVAAALGTLSIIANISAYMAAWNGTIVANTAITKLAAAAQAAWNLVMAASPAGLLVAAVVGIGVALTAYKLATSDAMTAETLLKDSQSDLAESFETVGSSASTFIDGISTAESHLSVFNDTLFASAEEQQALKENMQVVQDGITTICKTASDERRDYTDKEVKQLDDYFKKLNELNEQQYALEQAKMDAVKQQAITASETRNGDLKDYQKTSQEWIKTSEEQAEKQKSILEEQTINEIALLNQRYGDNANLQNEAYAKEYNKVIENKGLKLDAINDEVSAVTEAYANGYADQISADDSFSQALATANKAKEQEEQRYNNEMTRLKNEYTEATKDIDFDNTALLATHTGEVQALEEAHAIKMSEIWSGITNTMSGEQAEQLGVWLGMQAMTASQGRQLSEETRNTVKQMTDAWGQLPEETQSTITKAIAPMLEQLSASKPELAGISKESGESIIKAFSDVMQTSELSQKTSKAFNDAGNGVKTGIQEITPDVVAAAKDLLEKPLEVLNSPDISIKAKKSGNSTGLSWIDGLGSVSAATAGLKLTNTFADGTKSGTGSAKSAATSVVNVATNTLGSVSASGEGTKVSSTFIAGFNSTAASARSAGAHISNTAKDSLGDANVTTVGQEQGKKFVSGISEKVPDAKNAGSAVGNAAKSGASSIQFHETGRNTGNAYIMGISGTAVSSNMAGVSLGNNAKSGAGSISANDAGVNFGQGFVNGINSQVNAAAQAAANLAAEALAAAQRKIDSHSPSKETEKLGRYFTQGFAQGISKNSQEAENAAIKLADSMLKALKRSSGNYKDIAKNAVNVFSDGMKSAVETAKEKAKGIVESQIKAYESGVNKVYKAAIADEKAAMNKRISEEEKSTKRRNEELKKRITESNKDQINAEIQANNDNLKAFKESEKSSTQQKIDTLKESQSKVIDAYTSAAKISLSTYSNAMENAAQMVQDKLTQKIENISNEAQQKYDAVIQKQESMFKKLDDYGKLYEKDSSGNIIFSDIKKETENLARYGNNLEQLKGKISSGLMDKIVEMNAEDALEYSDALLKLSTQELKTYNDAFIQKQNLADRISKQFYQKQIETIKTEYTSKIDKAFKDSQKSLEDIGMQSLKGFIKGMNSQKGDLEKAVRKVAQSIIEQMRKTLNTHSPSKEFEKIAVDCTDGLPIGYIKGIKDFKKTIANENKSLLRVADKTLDFSDMAAKLRASVKSENARMSSEIASSINHKVNGSVRVKSEEKDQNRIKMADELVEALERAGLTFKVNGRDFARLVREV